MSRHVSIEVSQNFLFRRRTKNSVIVSLLNDIKRITVTFFFWAAVPEVFLFHNYSKRAMSLFICYFFFHVKPKLSRLQIQCKHIYLSTVDCRYLVFSLSRRMWRSLTTCVPVILNV